VKVKVHCRADVLDETVSVVVPLHGTDIGLLPDQNVGIADSEHVETFVDEYVRVTDAPADVTVLALMVREAVGAGGAPATRTLPSGYQ
jgi:hypothetical protein